MTERLLDTMALLLAMGALTMCLLWIGGSLHLTRSPAWQDRSEPERAAAAAVCAIVGVVFGWLAVWLIGTIG